MDNILDVKLDNIQEAWIISTTYIIRLVLLLYSIDLGFWLLKKIVKKWIN